MITKFKSFESFELNEHDIVTLKKDLVDLLRNPHTIPSGTKGTIVYIYSSLTAVDVEFEINGETFVETVSVDDLEF